MTTDEFCKLVGVDEQTAKRWRMDGTGPRFCKAGRTVYYLLDHVHEWLKDNAKLTTREGGDV